MKVGYINNVYFRGKEDIPITSKFAEQNSSSTKSLSNVTPDFHINLPNSYKKLGEVSLGNGLILHSYKLSNGYKVSVVPIEGSPAVVKNYVNVGAMNETADIKGISHFLEHMAFNGTNGENGHLKLNVGDSFKKIDAMGGWANASTNYAITDYVNSTPLLNNKDLETQIKVIASMAEDLKLSDSMIEKEKNPVCSEINMILDNPQTIALDQTVRTLFNIKNPTDEMVGGSVQSIKNLTRQDVKAYYDKYYTPDNMNLVVTGDVNPEDVIKIVAKSFNSNKISRGRKFEEKLIPIKKTIRKDFVSDKATSTEIILGFAGPKNSDVKNRVAYDLAEAYLQSYSSGLKQNLKKYNAFPFIENEKIGTNPKCPRMTYLSVNSDDKKSEQVLKTLFDTISTLKEVSDKDLVHLKQKIKKEKGKAFEFSQIVNDKIGQAVLDNNVEYISNYEQILSGLTKDDVNKALKEYFDLNKTAVTVVHPKLQDKVSFKGRTRQPIDMKNIEEQKLSNNFDIGFCNTKNNNFNYNISLILDIPYHKKAGVTEVLDMIYSMGTKNVKEDDWNKFKEDNNLQLNAGLVGNRLYVSADSSKENRKLILKKAKELLYNPNITQENLEQAIDLVRDSLERQQDSAANLYYNHEVRNNPYAFSNKEILDSLDSITIADIEDCKNYIFNNARGIITANLPISDQANCKNDVIKAGLELDVVKPNKIKTLDLYKENLKPQVLTKANNNSQADIMQIYKFKCDNSLKEAVLGKITNSILSNSSIGLFDNLREKQHLAYSVFSDISKLENQGEISCNILTTTDNKDVGEVSYDNVKKSIEGFTHQIEELRDGKFTDKDLENAKLVMKAELLNNEGVKNKLHLLDSGLNSRYGIDYENKLYSIVDEITKEDVIKFAEKIFKNPPSYSIVASQDTLDANHDFLENLKN